MENYCDSVGKRILVVWTSIRRMVVMVRRHREVWELFVIWNEQALLKSYICPIWGIMGILTMTYVLGNDGCWFSLVNSRKLKENQVWVGKITCKYLSLLSTRCLWSWPNICLHINISKLICTVDLSQQYYLYYLITWNFFPNLPVK